MEGTVSSAEEAPARQGRARGVVRVNLASALGMVFCTYAAPGSALLTLFLQDWLHADKWQIGLVMTLAYLGPTFEPAGAFLTEWLGRRRWLFIIGFLGNRLPFFGLAIIPFLDPVKSRDLSIALVLGIVALTRVFAHLGNPAWWSWMGDLVPAPRRGRFFACRSQATSAVAAVSFIIAMLLLHYGGGMANRPLVGALFAIGTLFGVIDILLYFAVPEPDMRRTRRRLDRTADTPRSSRRSSFELFLSPLRLPAYRRLILGVGLWAFSVNLVMPFLPVYQYGETIAGSTLGLGLSWKFLAVLNVTGSVAAMLTSGWWGRFSERLGSRRLLLLASLHLFINLAYLAIPAGRLFGLLVLVALINGALTAAWAVGVNQLLLGLAPRENRSVFVSVFNCVNGWLMAGGPILGGCIADRFPMMSWSLPGGLGFCYFHLLVVVASIGGLAALAVLFFPAAEATPQYAVLSTRVESGAADISAELRRRRQSVMVTLRTAKSSLGS